MINQFTIGRGDDCQIRIQDPTQKVSRNHATLKIMKNRKFFITDHSTNGTWVNGVKISPNVDYPVKRGDVISFANVADLNWELIPKTTNKPMIYVLVVALLFIVLGGAYFIYDYQQKKEKEKQEQETKQQADQKKKELRIKAVNDSTRKADSVRISQKAIRKVQAAEKKKAESEKKPEPPKEKKDSAKVEKPKTLLPL